MEHTVSRADFLKASESSVNTKFGGWNKTSREFNFIVDKIIKLPNMAKWMWTEGCRSVITRHELYSEKGYDDVNLVPTKDKNGELHDNEWFNFKGIPHHAFGYASQVAYLKHGGCRYDIDGSEWEDGERENISLPSIQELFQMSPRKHILINHIPNDKSSIMPQILVNYWTLDEFKKLGHKLDRKTLLTPTQGNSESDARLLKELMDEGVPIDHFERAKWVVEQMGEGYHGYYTPEFVLTFSFPANFARDCGPYDQSDPSNQPRFFGNCIAITSNKCLQDFLTACDSAFFDTTANLNIRSEWRKFGSGKHDWRYIADCVTVNVAGIHMAINEALWVLGYSIRKEVRDVCKPRLFSQIRKSKDLIDLFGPDNGEKQYGAAVMVLPKVSYTGTSHRSNKHTGLEIKPHDRVGHWRKHPTAGMVWVKSCEVKGGTKALDDGPSVARVKRNDKAV